MQDYLYNNNRYWLGSPCDSHGPYAHAFYVYASAPIYGYNQSVSSTSRVRPVVTLLANTSYTGTGTTTDPFVVQ